MKATLALLPGDGIGPEVVAAARTVLVAVATDGGHEFTFEEHDIGGIAIDRQGTPLPEGTLEACAASDAVLLGAVGGPRWGPGTGQPRPEQGLLGLRQALALFANLRPIPVFSALLDRAPIKASILAGTDLLFVRELTGGLYFGPRQEADSSSPDEAFDTMIYRRHEIERVAHVAFKAAQRRARSGRSGRSGSSGSSGSSGRPGRVTSIDKANVLASMRLWRRVVDEVASQYPDIILDHQLVDSAAMRLLTAPTEFDVLLTPNLFGDILSDEASVLAGSLGLLPSASLGAGTLGLYEPVHGSAPDIAGRGIANPLGAILSGALMLRHSLGLEAEAEQIETAVAAVLEDGIRTADLADPHSPGAGSSSASTSEVTAAVVARLWRSPEPSKAKRRKESSVPSPTAERCHRTGMG
jgi:3-isopropylmalate dehydrogenase